MNTIKHFAIQDDSENLIKNIKSRIDLSISDEELKQFILDIYQKFEKSFGTQSINVLIFDRDYQLNSLIESNLERDNVNSYSFLSTKYNIHKEFQSFLKMAYHFQYDNAKENIAFYDDSIKESSALKKKLKASKIKEFFNGESHSSTKNITNDLIFNISNDDNNVKLRKIVEGIPLNELLVTSILHYVQKAGAYDNMSQIHSDYNNIINSIQDLEKNSSEEILVTNIPSLNLNTPIMRLFVEYYNEKAKNTQDEVNQIISEDKSPTVQKSVDINDFEDELIRELAQDQITDKEEKHKFIHQYIQKYRNGDYHEPKSSNNIKVKIK